MCHEFLERFDVVAVGDEHHLIVRVQGRPVFGQDKLAIAIDAHDAREFRQLERVNGALLSLVHHEGQHACVVANHRRYLERIPTLAHVRQVESDRAGRNNGVFQAKLEADVLELRVIEIRRPQLQPE